MDDANDDPSNQITLKVLAVLDNLENAEYLMVKDGFIASFSTLLQSNTDIFGDIAPGKFAPDNVHVTITNMPKQFTKKEGWNVKF